MNADERKSETPQCEAYYQELDDWGLYAKKYGHLPEAHDQCPIEISPKEFAEKLERELTAANEQIKRVREETIEEAAKVAENPKMKWHLDLEDLDYPWKKRENREQVRIAQEIRALKC